MATSARHGAFEPQMPRERRNVLANTVASSQSHVYNPRKVLWSTIANTDPIVQTELSHMHCCPTTSVDFRTFLRPAAEYCDNLRKCWDSLHGPWGFSRPQCLCWIHGSSQPRSDVACVVLRHSPPETDMSSSAKVLHWFWAQSLLASVCSEVARFWRCRCCVRLEVDFRVGRECTGGGRRSRRLGIAAGFVLKSDRGNRFLVLLGWDGMIVRPTN